MKKLQSSTLLAALLACSALCASVLLGLPALFIVGLLLVILIRVDSAIRAPRNFSRAGYQL